MMDVLPAASVAPPQLASKCQFSHASDQIFSTGRGPGMGRSLPPLNALRAFDIAARTNSFTAAARELHVSQGAVSRHIAQLEAFLGVPLFRRDHSRAQLTTAGAEYARAIGTALDEVEKATHCMRAMQQRPLRIKLFPSVAIKWLIARLAEFHGLHPEIDVRITTTPTLVRLDPAEEDFTIQIGNLPQPGVHYDKLISIELMPVGAAAYLQRLPPVLRPDDLLGHVLLSSIQRPNDWRLWFERAGVIAGEIRQGLRFGNSALAYQAAIDGMGVVIAQKELVRDDLASGRLVPVHPFAAGNGEAYYLASAETAHTIAEVAAFRQWILSKRSIVSA
jgi:LysR family transcriptional regulator, glycine cleavage system transcriptional activator